MRSPQRPMPPGMLRRAIPPFFILFCLVFSGCAKTFSQPLLTRRIVVLNFQTPDDFRRNPQQVKGWWFGARTVFQNPQAGDLLGDAIGNALRSLNYVEQHSRLDLKYYIASKRRLLMGRFKDRDDAQYDRMLAEISPLDYGLDLGVDQVITGEILNAFTSHHRTIHTWYSTARVRVDLWDVARAKVVWSREFNQKNRFASQEIVFRNLAVKVIRSLDRSFHTSQIH